MKIIFPFLFLFTFVSVLFGQQTNEEQVYRSLAIKLYNEALQFDSTGNDVAALKALGQALFLDAGFARAYSKSAEIKMRQGKLDDALEDVNKSLAISEDYQAYQTRAEINYKKGDFEKAKSDIALARKMAGSIDDTPSGDSFEDMLVNDMYEQGLQLIAQNKMEPALDKFNEIIALNPNFAKAYLQKGLIYADFADYTAAANNLEMARQIEPSALTDLYIIKVMLKMDKSAEALQRFETIKMDELSTQDVRIYREVVGELADLLYLSGLELQQAGDFDEALNNFQHLIKLTPGFADAYFHIGEIYVQSNNNSQAVAAFDKSIQLNPAKNALLARGKLKSDLGDLDGAFSDLAMAKEMKPLDVNKLSMPSDFISLNNDLLNPEIVEPAKDDENVLAMPQKAEEQKPEEVVIVEEAGKGELVEEVLAETIHETEPVAEHMSYFDAIDLADQLYKTGDMDAAIHYYQEASRIDPNKNYPKTKIREIQNSDNAPDAPGLQSFDDLIVGGDYYFGIKAYKNARSKYQEALLLNPENEYAAQQIEIIDELEQGSKAATSKKETPDEKDIDELPGKDAGSLEGSDESVKYYNEGLELYYDSDLEGALEKFRQAINLDPELVDAYYNSGFIKLNQADFNEAIADFDIVLSITPNDKAYFYKGRALMGLNRLEEAAIQYTMAIEMNPQFFYAYNNRGNVLFQLGEYEASVIDFTKAITINPEYVFAYNNRGNAYFKLDKYPEALSDYNFAIDLRPEYGFAYLNRGITHEILGNMDEACADWKKSAELGIQVGNVYYQEQCEKE